MPGSGTEPKVDLAVVNLSFYPLSCTDGSWDISINCLFQAQQRVIPIVGI